MMQDVSHAICDIFGQIRKMVHADESLEKIEETLQECRVSGDATPDEIEQVEDGLQNLTEPLPGVAWIESKTRRTDLIIERIWGRYHAIVILLPENGIFITGQGKLINCIYNHYDANEILKNFSYRKGGDLLDCGFFESNVRIDESLLLQSLQNHIQPISQHIFLFPFIPTAYDDGSSIDIQKQTQILFDGLDANVWENEPFKVFECRPKAPKATDCTTECCLNYDEYSYFHEYVRKALFNFSSYKEKSEKFTADAKAVSTFFRYRLPGVSTFKIDIAKHTDGKQVGHLYPYRLAIRGITLRLFKTGVAILGIELHNYCYNRFEDIQRINDYGRRVYPQFIEKPSMEIPKGKFLPDAVTIDIKGLEPITERFEIHNFWLNGNERLINIGRHITELLGEELCKSLYIQPIIDDRMFTLCWYTDQPLVDNLTKKSIPKTHSFYRRHRVVPTGSGSDYRFETAEEWYRFVFIDGNGCNCQDAQMRKEQIAASTYRRWASWGTLYGISRYSMMCLTTPDAPPYLREHMRRHYRQMAELLLAQRASMIVFSNRISELSGKIDNINDKTKGKDLKKIATDVRKLHGDYIGFVNRLWFDEVTPQEQGIEMYDIAVRNMRLKDQMQELKAEIKELYEFMEMQESNTMNSTMLKLTKVASLGIPLTVVLAFWGISNDFVVTIDINQPFAFLKFQGWRWVIGSLVIAFCFGLWIQYWATKEEK